MNSPQYGGRGTQMEQFEKLLKDSSFFNDCLNTHRRATAEVMAEFIGVMVKAGALDPPQVMQVLHKIECEPGKPSIGSARRLVAGLIRDAMHKSDEQRGKS